MITLDKILRTVAEYGASDLHIVSQSEPQIRISGKLSALDLPKLDDSDTQALCYSILTDTQKKKFEENKELDFVFNIQGIGRFRANYYLQRSSVAASFRIIPQDVLSLDDLNAPPIFKELVQHEKGLILVTGATGSGKSTTLAAMIKEINLTEHKHILTIEDPIEFNHTHIKSIVSQRCVGDDTNAFATALKYAMREDPDVILVGEMRDVETIRAALIAAETGHLVLGTIHTNSAPQTINRIINVFPHEEQAIIRTQLSMSLNAIIAQTLVPTIDGKRIAAHEILINTPAIANLIREDKAFQIHSQMQLGQNISGMQTMTQNLKELVTLELIDKENAMRYAINKEEMKSALEGIRRFCKRLL
jgi:twitching motility protein PilT